MEFTKRLMTWYDANKRELPFRKSKDPYHIWISEVMAQQTQIATMLPYYERWIKHFPDVQSLADASIEVVLKHWEGLGYYNRARNLHRGANFIVENFNGQIPSKKEQLLTIPGIGDYTASAIAAIAFDEQEIAIDGNVKRVMARFLNYTESVNTRQAHRYFETYLKEKLLIGGAKPSEFVQALMELGALVYTPSNITCEGSPFKEMCAGYRGENVGTIPFIPKAKKVPVYDMSVLINRTSSMLLLSSDDSDGLMKGLVRLPQIEGHLDEEPIYKLKHTFSHKQWNINVYWKQEVPENDKWYYSAIDHLDDLTIITAHRKILNYLFEHQLL